MPCASRGEMPKKPASKPSTSPRKPPAAGGDPARRRRDPGRRAPRRPSGRRGTGPMASTPSRSSRQKLSASTPRPAPGSRGRRSRSARARRLERRPAARALSSSARKARCSGVSGGGTRRDRRSWRRPARDSRMRLDLGIAHRRDVGCRSRSARRPPRSRDAAPATVAGGASRSSSAAASASMVGWSNISVAGSGLLEAEAGAEPVAQLHRHQRIEPEIHQPVVRDRAARSASSRSTRTTASRTKSRSSSRRSPGTASSTCCRKRRGTVGGRGGSPRPGARPSRPRRRRRRCVAARHAVDARDDDVLAESPRPASPARGQALDVVEAGVTQRAQPGRGRQQRIVGAQIVGEVLPALDQAGA